MIIGAYLIILGMTTGFFGPKIYELSTEKYNKVYYNEKTDKFQNYPVKK